VHHSDEFCAALAEFQMTGLMVGVDFCGQCLNLGGIPNMSNQAQLSELEEKHKSLEHQLDEARHHPSTDDLTILELKRRKLLVKDEIARLRGSLH
jgi:hypothetical protein